MSDGGGCSRPKKRHSWGVGGGSAPEKKEAEEQSYINRWSGNSYGLEGREIGRGGEGRNSRWSKSRVYEGWNVRYQGAMKRTSFGETEHESDRGALLGREEGGKGPLNIGAPWGRTSESAHPGGEGVKKPLGNRVRTADSPSRTHWAENRSKNGACVACGQRGETALPPTLGGKGRFEIINRADESSTRSWNGQHPC